MVDLGKEVYQEKIEDDLAFMRYLARDIGEMTELREAAGEDRKLEAIVRHIVFLETQTIEALREQVIYDRKVLKDLENRRSLECAA